MEKFLRMWRRVVFFIRRNQMDQDLAEEMSLHMEVVVATASVSCEPWAFQPWVF
ncbi:MAG TPA: hypothetical protein VMW38_26800 [Terriglobia bacterium]|nr:hypothetical protein [Terriglobia bacterium]